MFGKLVAKANQLHIGGLKRFKYPSSMMDANGEMGFPCEVDVVSLDLLDDPTIVACLSGGLLEYIPSEEKISPKIKEEPKVAEPKVEEPKVEEPKVDEFVEELKLTDEQSDLFEKLSNMKAGKAIAEITDNVVDTVVLSLLSQTHKAAGVQKAAEQKLNTLIK